MKPPTFIVTCSCNRQSKIRWAKSISRYISFEPGWHPSYPEGWTCGREGHIQKTPPEIEGQAKKWDFFKIVV